MQFSTLTLPLAASLWLTGDAVAISRLSVGPSVFYVLTHVPAPISHCVIDFVAEMNDRIVNK